MIEIALTGAAWRYDPAAQLGSTGGFGSVFRGSGAGGAAVAVKRLHLSADDVAHREMRLAEVLAARELHHVIPVLDAGKDANSDAYFVVMPLAEGSLADEMRKRGKLPPQEVASILLQIAQGLNEVPDIVHRDLKPPNVLKHDGQWKIADFGIARFVEEATSSQTLKGFLSWPYAAPEQWFAERSTGATDIYALGCIAHALLSGHPPFAGPSEAEYRIQHLTAIPPALASGLPALDSLVTTMLRKPAESRPGRKRVVEILSVAEKPLVGEREARGRLERLGVLEATRVSEEEAAAAAAAADRVRRNALAKAAYQQLRELAQRLLGAISDAMPTANVINQDLNKIIRAGTAQLEVEMGSETLPRDAFPRSGWDAIAQSKIAVREHSRPYKWSASLFFMRSSPTSEYRWYEVSFFYSLGSSKADEPFALNPTDADAALATSMHHYAPAFGPMPIDDEAFDTFADRWMGLFAEAYERKLQRPWRLPLG